MKNGKNRGDSQGGKVFFLGNGFSFSEQLVLATERGLTGLKCIQLAAPDVLFDANGAELSGARALILDQDSLRMVSRSDSSDCSPHVRGKISLAYLDTEEAAGIYNDSHAKGWVNNVFPLNVQLDIWISYIQLVTSGGHYLCPSIYSKPGKNGEAGISDPTATALTPRQADVLREVLEGLSNKQIAAKLGVSEHTVKLHLHRANLRLGAKNRTEAAMLFRKNQK